MYVKFVRVIKQEGQKRGFAVDKAGKLWRGFFATCEWWQVRLGQAYGSGLCFCCRELILEGWESCGEAKGVKRDLCDHCVSLPQVAIVNPRSKEEWIQLLREFRHENFDHEHWNGK